MWPVAEEVAERHTVDDPVVDEVVKVLAQIHSDNAVITASDLYMAIGVSNVTKRRGSTGRAVVTGARRAGCEATRSDFLG